MCLDTADIAQLVVIVSMITLGSVEAYVLSECITVLDSNTDKSIFCATGEIIQIEDVTLYRSNSRTHCEALDPSNVSPYPCQTMSTKVTDTIWRRCHGQNNCYYELEYPDEDDCPVDYQRDRIILLVISLQCVSQDTTTATTFTADQDREGVSIGAAVGGTISVILITAMVIMVIVYISYRRSRAKSPSHQEPITMNTNTIYENNGDSPSYVNSAVERDRTPGYYEEILDSPADSSQVGPYEEMSDVVTDRPSVQDGNTYEPLRHETSNTPANFHSQHIPKNTKSLYENMH